MKYPHFKIRKQLFCVRIIKDILIDGNKKLTHHAMACFGQTHQVSYNPFILPSASVILLNAQNFPCTANSPLPREKWFAS
jgi:hypothetical protein